VNHDAQLVPIESLKPYKGNPRRGNIDAIRESLRVNKQYRPVVVREKTREVLAGNHTAPGNIVLDPFAGSGTAILAAENLHRRCYAIEIDPGYCDVITNRWEQHTGRKAVRADSDDA